MSASPPLPAALEMRAPAVNDESAAARTQRAAPHELLQEYRQRLTEAREQADDISARARKAAEAARCAVEQGKFWEMHDLLFRNQKALQLEALTGYARQLGLQAPAFEACLAQGKYAPAIQQDLTAGTAAGVHGTPGFVLGTPQPDGTIQGIALRGAQPIAAFRQAIARVLGEP